MLKEKKKTSRILIHFAVTENKFKIISSELSTCTIHKLIERVVS